MPRPAATLLFCICIATAACNGAKSAAPQPTAAKAEEAHAYHLAERVESATPAATTPSPAACGGGEQAGCCQGEGACGASCGQGGGEHAACGGANTEQAQEEDTVAALTRVDASQVCMVRNHFMGRPQLAVQADGTTYYGCCAGCANRLFKDAQARQAIDPVSHNAVDKGLAVLGKTARGQVLYFENEANFETFRAQAGTLTQ